MTTRDGNGRLRRIRLLLSRTGRGRRVQAPGGGRTDTSLDSSAAGTSSGLVCCFAQLPGRGAGEQDAVDGGRVRGSVPAACGKSFTGRDMIVQGRAGADYPHIGPTRRGAAGHHPTRHRPGPAPAAADRAGMVSLTLVTNAVAAWTTEYYGPAVESMRAAVRAHGRRGAGAHLPGAQREHQLLRCRRHRGRARPARPDRLPTATGSRHALLTSRRAAPGGGSSELLALIVRRVCRDDCGRTRPPRAA